MSLTLALVSRNFDLVPRERVFSRMVYFEFLEGKSYHLM
jgi:hypothetical protein